MGDNSNPLYFTRNDLPITQPNSYISYDNVAYINNTYLKSLVKV
ncbi:hypothetical protein POKO110462_18250 [Pontibacter korlensis]